MAALGTHSGSRGILNELRSLGLTILFIYFSFLSVHSSLHSLHYQLKVHPFFYKEQSLSFQAHALQLALRYYPASEYFSLHD